MEKIEEYTIKVDNMVVTVTILGGKNVMKTYSVAVPTVAPATRALMNYIKHGLISEVSVSTGEMLDPKAIVQLKEKFSKRAVSLLKDKLPNITGETSTLLINILMQEMLGLGDVEYLLNDEALEEIVINSSSEPVRVFHKRYGWLETNILIESEEKILNYSNIIARRVGRQITTLNPLLDAHLITGDRANAVLFPICTKGHTITIRKFARDPWTLTDFIKNKTVSSKVLALIWLSIQYEMNVLISGGTGSGKTSFLNIVMPFMPPNHRIVSIEDSVHGDSPLYYVENDVLRQSTIGSLIDSKLKEQRQVLADGTEVFQNKNIQILSVTKNGKVELRKPSSLIRHFVEKDMYEVTLASGKKIKVTGDHSLFSIIDDELCPVRCADLKIGDRLATVPKLALSVEVYTQQRQSLTFSDVSSESIIDIQKQSFKGNVYDLSVPGTENFVCENIVCHNTRELQLPKYLYWCPLTIRQPNPEGKGAVEMLDLLINSLRMRPDRIILGEMRKKDQASVLFEAMHTGHSVYATVHADSIAETIDRLINPPIEVPRNLLTGVHLNVVMFRDRRRGIRRVFQVGEFLPTMEEGTASVKPNILYRWKPGTDEIVEHSASVRIFEELSRHTGLTLPQIEKDMLQKQKILDWMVANNIRHVDAVGELIRNYYIDPEAIISKVGEI